MPQHKNSRFAELDRNIFEKILSSVWERIIHFDALEFVGAWFLVFCILAVSSKHVAENAPLPSLKEGEVAHKTLRVPKTIEIQDEVATRRIEAEALSKVTPVYVWRGVVTLNKHKEAWRQCLLALKEEDCSQNFSKFQRQVLRSLKSKKEIFKIPERIFSGPYANEFFILPDEVSHKQFDFRLENSPRFESSEILDPESVFFVSELKQRIVADRGIRGLSPNTKIQTAIQEILTGWVEPNLTLDALVTDARKKAATRDLKPVTLKLYQGEVIVREGERLSSKGKSILDALHYKETSQLPFGMWALEAILGALFVWSGLRFIKFWNPRALPSKKDLAVAGVLLLTFVCLFKVFAVLSIDVIAEYFKPDVPAFFFLLLIPFAAPAIMGRLLQGSLIAALMSVCVSISVVLLFNQTPLLGLFVGSLSLAGATFFSKLRVRGDFYIAGLKVALVGGVLASLLSLVWVFEGSSGDKVPFFMQGMLQFFDVNHSWWTTFIWSFVGGFLCGVHSTALTFVLTPLLETLLDYTTDFKLLELARMDHPLLKELVMKAPGTYHHSMVVGSLVEAGAEAIGANALLARVGAYYHDIGKALRPEYFVENQVHGINRHDQTTPQLSAKIIVSHVKEGHILAEKFKLGSQILAFIDQHHGTGVVQYFYSKAKQQAAKPGEEIDEVHVDEEEFRYPGPKPQTKEVAILALADCCEAATRSLVEPTPARLDSMVSKIFMKFLDEGMLDECEITMREVYTVKNAFVRILLGIYHNRIQYPDQEKGLSPRTSK